MDNRRRQHRKYLTYFSQVSDRESGMMLGYLVDLTTGGALMIGNYPLDINVIYQLRVELPDGFDSQTEMTFDAKAVWVQPDVEPEFYRIGLQLIEIEPRDLVLLEKLLTKYSTPE
jgi:hypothetical protein